MRLAIRYGKALEMQRVRMTLAKTKWFQRRNYKPLLPKGISESSDSDHIKICVENEYNPASYDSQAKLMAQEFENLSATWIPKVKKIFGPNVPNVLELILTKYGTGGSYFLPNTVMINIAGNQMNKSPVAFLKSQIVALLVEPYAQKKALPQEEREKLVYDTIKRVEEVPLS